MTHLTPLLDALVQLLAMVVLAVGVAATRRLADWLQLAADDRVRGYLRSAMDVAVAQAISSYHEGKRTVPQALEDAEHYMRTGVPDALRRLKVDDQHLRRMLWARMDPEVIKPSLPQALRDDAAGAEPTWRVDGPAVAGRG